MKPRLIIPRSQTVGDAGMRTNTESLAEESPGTSTNEEIGPFRDIPSWIWAIFLAAWAVVFGLFVLFFTTDGGATFAVTIATLFAAMAFGLPMAMAGQSRCRDRECGDIIQTRSGPLSASAAAVQIVLIPIAAAIGLTALITVAM